MSEDFYQSEEEHSNCNQDDLENHNTCSMVDGYLTCSQSECGGDIFRCVCHIVQDMGGWVIEKWFAYQMSKFWTRKETKTKILDSN